MMDLRNSTFNAWIRKDNVKITARVLVKYHHLPFSCLSFLPVCF